MIAASSAHLDGAAGRLAALAGWASAQADQSAGLVGAAETCFDIIGTAWGGPRAAAAISSGRSYVATQRSTADALTSAAGILRAFASAAADFAVRPPVGVEVQTTNTQTETQLALHKYPGGGGVLPGDGGRDRRG